MTFELAFVDAISATPNNRLSLYLEGWKALAAGTEFGMPSLRRAVSSTLLADGDHISAAAYGSRIITLSLDAGHLDPDDAAAQMQLLSRELDRPRNILRYRAGTTEPVFFRTERSDYSSVQWDATLRRATVTLLAEPFAYGVRESFSPVTVNNDPAHASNPMRWDITGVKGDVETPAFVKLASGGLITTSEPKTVLGIRRRGTPSNAPYLLQAESMTMSADTAVQANDAVMSGAGSNFIRCTFATSATMQQRAYMNPFPAAGSVDNRGTYRVFVRTRRSDQTSVIKMRMAWLASGTAVGDTVTAKLDIDRIIYDLGLIQFPAVNDPVFDGYSGTELPARGSYFALELERVSGTGNIDIDYFLFVPADDAMAIIDWPNGGISTDHDLILDGPNEVIYARTTATDDVYTSGSPIVLAGGFLKLSPGVTNRVHLLRSVDTVGSDTIGDSTVVTVSYWPRYLHVRPVAA